MDRKRMNAGYEIVQSIQVGNAEFVLGVSRREPGLYVTWECKNKTNYFWGHYTDNPLKATRDLCERVLKEVRYLEQRQMEREEETHRPEQETIRAVGKGNRDKER